MILRKTQQPSEFADNQIHDAYSTSTTDTYSCNYVNNKFTYSLEEQVVGKWIDGRNVYKKMVHYVTNTVIGQAGANQVTNISIAHNISNLDFVLDSKIYVPSFYMFPFINANNSGILYMGIPQVSTTDIILRIINDEWSSFNAYIELIYVKTTD